MTPPRALLLLLVASSAAQAGPRTVVADPPPARGKVWTADDLAGLRGGTLSVVGAPMEATPAPAPSAPAKTTLADAGAITEAQWRAAALHLEATAARLEARLARIEEIAESWRSYVLGTDAYDSVGAHELSKLQRERDEATAALAQTRGEKVLLEERARRAGVPPGWLREARAGNASGE